MTRRVVRYKYDNTEMKIKTDKYGTRLIEIQKDVEGETHGTYPDGRTWRKFLAYIEPKIPYNPGSILYVRETWRVSSVEGKNGVYTWVCQYKADMSEQEIHTTDFEKYSAFGKKYFDKSGWIPSLHMPKEAARIFLRVKDVKIEQLQDITEDGVCEEGAEKLITCPNERTIYYPDGGIEPCFNTNVCGKCNYIDKAYPELFGELVWNEIVKPADRDKYGWDANPWVWVIEFERIIPKEESE